MNIQEMQKNVRAIHGLWLKDHLDNYIFLSQPAKELKEKIEAFDIQTATDTEAIKNYYFQFISMFQNNPYLVMNGLLKKDQLHIISEHYEYYLVENDSFVLVPIQFAKEKSSPKSQEYSAQISNSLKEQSEYAIATAQKISGTFMAFVVQRNKSLVPPKTIGASKVALAGLTICLELISIVLFGLLTASVSGKSILTTIVAIVLIGLLVYASIISGRIFVYVLQGKETSKSKKADVKNLPKSIEEIINKIPGQCSQLLYFIDNYFSGNEAKEKETIKYSNTPAGAYIAGEIQPESQKDITEQNTKKEAIPKKVPNISFMIPTVMTVFCIFIFLLSGLFRSGILSDDSMATNGTDATNGSEANTKTVKTYDVYVAAPVINLRSEANAGSKDNIIGTYNQGTGLYLVDKTVNDSGTLWLQVKDDNGKIGWVSRKVVRLFESDEIKLRAALASSELPTKNGDKSAKSAIDGYLQSSWQEGVTDDGVGESITVKFDEEVVKSFSIINGNVSTEDAYKQNGRIKQAEVTFDNGEKTIIEFDDAYNYEGTRFKLETPVKATSMTIVILSVYSGSKYKDTCITEIGLFK